MANKRMLELDEEVRKIIDEQFAEFEPYLPCIQDVNVYRRKRKEYWDKISAKIKERNARNGRTDDTASAGNSAVNAE